MNNIIKAGILTAVLLLLTTSVIAFVDQHQPSEFALVAREKSDTVCNTTCYSFGAGACQPNGCSCMGTLNCAMNGAAANVNSSNLYLAFHNITPAASVELVCYGDTGAGNPVEWNFTYLYRFQESQVGVNGLSGITWNNQPIYCSPEGGYCYNSWGGEKVTNYGLHSNGFIDRYVKWNLTELGLYGSSNTEGYPTFNLTDIYLLLTARIQNRAYSSRARFNLQNFAKYPNGTNMFVEGFCWLETSGLLDHSNINVSVLVNNQLKPGVQVSICDNGSQYQQCFNSITGIDGTTSNLLPYGTYTVTAIHHGQEASKSVVADQPYENVYLALTCSACANANMSYAGLVITNGQPVNGSIVTLFPLDSEGSIYMGVSNTNGFFNITGVVGGDYVAEASITLDHPYSSYHNVHIAGNEVDYFILDSTKQVYGIVYDGYSTTPVPYATVRLMTTVELIPQIRTTITDANGRYTILLNSTIQTCRLPIFPYTIPCSYNAQATKTINGITYSGSETFGITNQSTNVNIYILGTPQEQTYNLSIQTYDNSTCIGNSCFRIVGNTGTIRLTSGTFNNKCYIDQTGKCVIENITTGNYNVITNITNYNTYTKQHSITGNYLPLYLTPSTIPTIIVSGRITLSLTTTGLANITIQAMNTEGDFTTYYNTTSDINGYYILPLPSKHYYILLPLDLYNHPPRYTPAIYNPSSVYLSRDYTKNFIMDYDNTSQGNTTYISGFITDNSTGNPMPASTVNIRVTCGASNTNYGDFTNDNNIGFYNITNLPYGVECILTYSAQNYLPQTHQITTFMNWNNFDISLERVSETTCTIDGWVLKGGTAATPIDNCAIHVYGATLDGAGIYHCEDSGNDKGKFRLLLRKGKDYTLDISSNGYTTKTGLPLSTNVTYWDYVGPEGLLGNCHLNYPISSYTYLEPKPGQELCDYEIYTQANSGLTLGINIPVVSKIYFHNTDTGDDYEDEPELVGHTHTGELPCGKYNIRAVHYYTLPIIPSGVYKDIEVTHEFTYPYVYKITYTFTELSDVSSTTTTLLSGHHYTNEEIIEWMYVNIPPIFFLLVLMFLISSIKRL